MFIVLSPLVEDEADAPEHVAGGHEWLARGFGDGIFVLAGSLHPGQGGAIIAHGVSAEVIEIAPGQVDGRLAFMRPDVKTH